MFSVTSGQPFLFQMLSRSFRFLQSRLFATKHRHTRNSFYYDVLKLPSTASQTQIKEAFFKLSKIHHPDVSDSEDSKLQFHLIADAYAILGNVHSRRMYDRGLISEATSAPLAKPEEEEYNPFKLPPKPVKSDLDKEVLQKYQDISVQRRREKQLGVAVKEKEKAKDHDSDNLVGVVMFKVGYHGYFFKDIDAKQMGYDKEAQRGSVPKTLY
uniref:DnaJ-like protein subfamily C member 30 n=1 Tax=Magallana gigas TaxID=29159 RepID=K1PFD4_MAGGI